MRYGKREKLERMLNIRRSKVPLDDQITR